MPLHHLTPSRALSAAGDLIAALFLILGGAVLIGFASVVGG